MEDLRTRQIKATRFLSLSPTMPSLAVRFDSHGSNKARERGRVFPFVDRRESWTQSMSAKVAALARTC
jgi:hypothetical protein